MKSVFVNEITAEWLAQDLPALAAALREQGAEAVRAEAAAAAVRHEEALATAREEAATAERSRILGIEAAALPGQEDLAAKLKADPAISLAAAQTAFLDDAKAKRAAHMGAIRKDEQGLHAPAPDAPTDSGVAQAGRDAVALARQVGAIPRVAS